MGLPERWFAEGPKWRCGNGHVSRMYCKSERLGGCVCLACEDWVWLTFPEDVDDVPA